MRTAPVVPAAVVEAAQAGDTGALEELVAAYLPLLYNIVGRALDQPADVDDVVQETLLRAVGNLPALRDPERFRSWLAAIAVRQIRNRIQERQTLRARTRPLAPAEAVPEPDFADVTILRLGLDAQRQDLAEAVRWLDPDDRDLLSLWCLELMGELTRDDLLTALQLSPSHVAVRLHRLRANWRRPGPWWPRCVTVRAAPVWVTSWTTGTAHRVRCGASGSPVISAATARSAAFSRAG